MGTRRRRASSIVVRSLSWAAVLAFVLGAAAGTAPQALAQSCAATLSLPDGLQQIPGQSFSVPVSVTSLTGLGVFSADVRLSYNPSVLQAPVVSAGSLTGACTVTPNTGTSGQVVISIFCVNEMTGSGTLATVGFTVAGNYGASSALAVTSAQLNEGNPSLCIDGGSFQVCGPELCDGLDNDCDGTVDEGASAACDDGNACNGIETCSAGTCTPGSPVICTASDQCHDAGTCDPQTGMCSNPSKPNGTSCDDGNLCTQADTCLAGTCTGTNPITCLVSDQCHDVGTCDPQTGMCSNPSKPNGTSCNDSNACTQTDTCQSGTCTGGNPVTCTASDQCHDAGTCNTGTGVCSNPNAPDGTGCSDNNACTQTDTCHAGVCTDGAPLTCNDSNQCTSDSCAPATGCVYTPVDLGTTTCGVGACTHTVPVCVDGVPQTCTPNPPLGPLDLTCDGIDGDCDGSTDEDFVPFTTHCGVAPCDRTGTATCVSGTLHDSCVAETTTVSVPATTSSPAVTVVVPVNASSLTGLGVLSADLKITYDESVVVAQSVSAGSLTGSCTVNANLGVTNQVLISIFCVSPLSGSGSLATITFLVTGPTGTTSPVHLASATLNEGSPSTCPVDGSVSSCGAQEFCDGRDNDCDGTTDEGFNAGVSCGSNVGTCPLPAHVVCSADGLSSACQPDLLLSVTPTSLTGADVQWTAIPGATFYDVVRGDLQTLASSGGNFTTSVGACLANDVTALSVADPSAPAVGGGYFYLMRATGCTGGTYDSGAPSQVGSRDAEIAASANACP